MRARRRRGCACPDAVSSGAHERAQLVDDQCGGHRRAEAHLRRRVPGATAPRLATVSTAEVFSSELVASRRTASRVTKPKPCCDRRARCSTGHLGGGAATTSGVGAWRAPVGCRARASPGRRAIGEAARGGRRRTSPTRRRTAWRRPAEGAHADSAVGADADQRGRGRGAPGEHVDVRASGGGAARPGVGEQPGDAAGATVAVMFSHTPAASRRHAAGSGDRHVSSARRAARPAGGD